MSAPSHSRKRRGQSLVSSLVAIVLITGSMLVVGKLMNVHFVTEKGTRDRDVIGDLRRRLLNANSAPIHWIESLRSHSTAIAACLPAPSGGGSNCPSLSQPDSQIVSIAKGRAISSVALVDSNGNDLTGTQATPIYFDETGLPCASTSCHAIKAEGYLLHDGAPGAVEFVAKFTPIDPAGSTPSAPTYERVEIGDLWQRIQPSRTTQSCNAFEVIDKITNGVIHCKPLTIPACAADKYLAGVAADGTPDCRDAPAAPPPTVPKTRFIKIYCESKVRGQTWNYCSVPGIGSAAITAVGLLYKYSSYGCDVGDEISYSGQQVRVKDKCAASILVTVVDP